MAVRPDVRPGALVLAGVLLLAPEGALAQAAPAADRGWEVRFVVGGSFLNAPAQGTSDLPEPGMSQSFGPPVNAFTRRVPSWFFGDGVQLANDAFTGSPVTARLYSLDPMLTRASMRRGSGPQFGVRARRPITRRLALEIGVERSGAGPTFSDAALADVETSRAAFEAVWPQFFSNESFGGDFFSELTVEATSALTPGSFGQWLLTGGLAVDLFPVAGGDFYAAAEAGVLRRTGDMPAIALTGRYAVTAGGRIPYDETDRVTIRLAADRAAFVTGLGAGWRRPLSPRWTMHAEIRAHFAADSTRIDITALPERVLISDRSRQLVLSSGGPSGIWFYNEANSSVQSTLSAPLTRFVTFQGTGTQRHVAATLGIGVRF
jgi:hypothetical protein